MAGRFSAAQQRSITCGTTSSNRTSHSKLATILRLLIHGYSLIRLDNSLQLLACIRSRPLPDATAKVAFNGQHKSTGMSFMEWCERFLDDHQGLQRGEKHDLGRTPLLLRDYSSTIDQTVPRRLEKQKRTQDSRNAALSRIFLIDLKATIPIIDLRWRNIQLLANQAWRRHAYARHLFPTRGGETYDLRCGMQPWPL